VAVPDVSVKETRRSWRMHRVRMPRRSPLPARRSPPLGFGLAWACLLALLALLLPGAAWAEGKPNLGLAATAPTSVLFGAKATVTLEASNPAGEPYGYNLSYRAVLPEGVAYVSGSSKLGSGGAAPAPTVIANQPKAGETTLIWSNVGDLSPASHSTLSFEVTPSQVTYPVASHFTVAAEAFVAEAPRYLPKFSAAGKPEGPGPTSFTGYAQGSAETAISALEIKQEEGSPEGEILRGVHDHQTVYKVIVTNNKVNSTTNVNVDDWLPAGLEYLGCGGAGTDHTTDAPTNPGSAEEYPGSGPIEVAALGGCTAPAFVETVETDPDGAGEDPTAVYTHLRWSVAELKPGESRTYEFRAAVPLRENTTVWTGAKPTPASGHQGVNLDNNSGKETRDGQTLTTFAKAEGLYNGVTTVSAEEHMTRAAKDLTTEKSADLKTLSDGQVTKWTILVHSSEYRYNTGVEVTDTLPNGLCPLSSTNLSKPVSAECEPNGDLPSSPYTSTKEEENGSWTLLWDETTDPALKTLKQNETIAITFYSKTRTHYQSKHAQAGPILSNDKIENKVIAAATTNVVCAGDTDCSEKGAKPIDHERPLSEPVQDNSHATQTAEGPAVKKEIAESGTNCLGDTYTSATPVYHPGDLVCWRLQASFPATLSTHGTQVTDFLPGSVLFDEAFNGGKGEAPTSEDTLPATTFDHSEAPGSEPGGALKWTLPESGIVGNGSQRFERVFATNATLPKGSLQGDLQGNLMKFASINSAGETFALRSEADFKLQFPQLSLEKQIVKINGAAIVPATSAIVKGTDEAEFALTVKNSGEVAAQHTEVRDLLPNGLTCAGIVAISNKGACSGERISWGETGLGEEAIGVPANGQTVLHFTAKVPTPIDPATTLEDRAGVREYHSATNIGTEYTYIPAENIDPLLTEKEANVPAANAQAQLVTEDVKMTKSHTTSVNETGNKANEATIGEAVTFEVTTTIPAGTALSGFAKITDPGIPTERLTYEVGSVEALVNGSAAPGTFKTEEVAGSPVVTLPENYAAPTSEPVKVTMRFKTYVTNVEANNSAGVEPAKSIPNTGKLAWTNPLSGAQVREAKDSVPLVEPSIALTQSNNAIGGKVHGGQLVEYSLKLKNAAGSSTAFGNEIVDTVPNGTMPANSKGEALKNGEATASGGIWNEVARTITWKLEKLEGGKEQVYAFFVTVNEAPVASTNLKNIALATTASLPTGASPATRTAADAPSASIKSRYESKTEANLEVEGSTIVKAGSPEKATIGEKITYTLTVTVPLHTVAFNETVIDTLPATLELAKYVSATCVSGCAPGPTEIEPKPYTAENNVAAHTNRVAWYLGNLTSALENRVLKLVYVAIVRSTARGSGAEVKAPAVLENAASLYYNTADSGYAFKEATVPPAIFTKTVGPVHAKTTVIEPSVAIVKEASVSGGAFSAATPFAVTDGSTITYRLQVTSSGTAPAYNVSVTDALPASGLVEVKTVANAPILSKEAEVTKETASELGWTIPVLGTPAKPGKTITLEYTAKLAPVTTLHQGQEIANTAKVPSYFGVPAAERTGESYFKEEVRYREYKGNEATLKAKVTLPTITIEKAALEGAKYQASANAEVNQPFTWRVIVTNTSTVAAKNLKVADILPPNWEYAGGASFSKGGAIAPTEAGTLEPGKELTWSTGIELAAGASTTLTYQAKPTLAAESNPGNGAAHPNKNTATATVLDAAGNPEDAEGPFAAGPASAQAVLLVPVLTVTKTAVKASVAAGAEDSYTIVVHNSGAGIAREVLAEDTLPAGMTYVAKSATASPATGFAEKSASATKIVWSIESIAAGTSVEIKVPVGTEASLASGTKLKNTVAVHATAAPTPVEAEGAITLTTSADLQATKIASVNPATPGGEETYTISVFNAGPSVAREVKLTDPLPAGTVFKSADLGCSDIAGTVECVVGELAPKASAVYHVTVTVESSVTTPILNTVEATSTTPDPEPKNNKASVEVAVSPEADLALEKTAPAYVITGEELTWTLIAKNNGPSDATGVTVVDPLPAGTSYLKSTSSQGSCAEVAGTLTCKLGALAAGASAKITLTAKVTAAPGPLTNTATVSGKQPDPEPENNKSSATTTVLKPPSVAKASDSPKATIGSRVTYTLTVTVPAQAVTYNQTVIDTLPDTLDFDEYVSAECTSGCTTPETTIVPQSYTPDVLKSAPSTTSVAWYLGNVTAAPVVRTVVLVYRASVRETHRAPPEETVKASAEIKNSATLYYNQTEKGSFEEATIPTPESFDQKTSPVSTGTKVVEPLLTLTKEASVNGGGFSAAPFTITAADAVSYRLQVQNTGSSPAYNAAVTDVIPAGLTVVSTVTNPEALETKAWSETSPEIAWQIAGPLQPGETITLEYSVKLAPSSVKDGEELTNTATVPAYFGVSATERGEGKENFFKEKILYREYAGPSAQLTATVALPVLEVSKQPLHASAIAGNADSYTITVHNSGTSVAHEVKVLDTLPAGMTYEAGSATANPAAGFSEEAVLGDVVTWKIASIGTGESVEITVPVGVEASVETGSELTNRVAATATEQTTPVEAEGTIEVTTEADVEAKKSVLGGGTTAVPGEQLTYVVAAKNNGGPSVARAVVLTDKLPAGVSFVSASAGCAESGGTVTCAAGNLNPGEEASFQIVVSVLSNYSGSIANTVRAESTATPGHPATPDPEPANNEAHVEVPTLPSADLELVKTALTPEVHPGQQATFSLLVTNRGPSDAAEAKLVDTLPAGLAYVSVAGASCEAAGQVVSCALGTLTAGSSVTVELTTQPAALGSYTNTAAVSSPTPDPEPGNNSSEATVTVVPVPPTPVPPAPTPPAPVTPSASPTSVTAPTSGVSSNTGAGAPTRVTLRKLVRERVIAPGGRLDYRLTVRNAGARTAEKLKVCDDLPEQATVISRGGGHLAGAHLCFTLAALAAGRSHTFTLVLRADSNARGRVVNHATVTGRNFRPAHARASTPVQKASLSPARENHVTG
jgi:large repetitive protein